MAPAKESRATGFGGPDASSAGLSSDAPTESEVANGPGPESSDAQSDGLASATTSASGKKVMAYKGRSVTRRVISKEDMEKQGFTIPQDLEWSRQNGFVQDVSGLSDEAVEFLLKDKQLTLREG